MAELTKIDRNRELKQSNRLVAARYHLSTFEQRMMIAICSQLESDDDEFKTVRVKVTEMADFCEIKGNDKYRRVHNLLLKLMSRTLQLQKEDGNWYATHWLQSAEYLGNGVIEYRMDQRLKSDLLQLKTAYFSTPAEPLMKFRSEYAVRFYIIFQKSEKGQTFDLELDFIRDLFQLGDTYKQLSNIKERVIEPAISEINEISDLNIFHKYIKTGRMFNILRLVVTDKPTKKLDHNRIIAAMGEPQTQATPTPPPRQQEPQLTPTPAPPPAAPVAAKPEPTPTNPPPQTRAPQTTPAPPPAAPVKPSATKSALPAVVTHAQKPPELSQNAVNLSDLRQTIPRIISTNPAAEKAAKMADGSVEDILVARMTDAGHWKLSKNMAHKLIDRYGAERVSVNLSYAEQHQNSEYKHGSWLIHSIVTDMVNKYK